MEASSTVHDFRDGDSICLPKEGLEGLSEGKGQSAVDSNVLRCMDDGFRWAGHIWGYWHRSHWNDLGLLHRDSLAVTDLLGPCVREVGRSGPLVVPLEPVPLFIDPDAPLQLDSEPTPGHSRERDEVSFLNQIWDGANSGGTPSPDTLRDSVQAILPRLHRRRI